MSTSETPHQLPPPSCRQKRLTNLRNGLDLTRAIQAADLDKDGAGEEVRHTEERTAAVATEVSMDHFAAVGHGVVVDLGGTLRDLELSLLALDVCVPESAPLSLLIPPASEHTVRVVRVKLLARLREGKGSA